MGKYLQLFLQEGWDTLDDILNMTQVRLCFAHCRLARTLSGHVLWSFHVIWSRAETHYLVTSLHVVLSARILQPCQLFEREGRERGERGRNGELGGA
eukprot:2022313-Rhodomonas_salina.2